VFPELFRIPIVDFPVSSFGVMLALAFLVGAQITKARLVEEGQDPEQVWNLLLWVMVGGILGSKLYFAVDMALRSDDSFWSLLFARAGITWYGGLAGGSLLGLIGCRVHGIPLKTGADCTAVGLAVGQALGRIGCFLVGDDYGRPSDVPWAVAFPEGAPPTTERVHPTMLYEVAWLLPVAALLWSRRRKSPFLFGEYLVLNGLGRFAIETWRVNPRVAFGLTEAQLIAIALVVLGSLSWLRYRATGPG
jgi:phosphatidylglycerol:prolipoprotein diacylglycerol transferase